MIAGARYAHTNLIARDWRGLAAFYIEVFGCVVVPPERDLSGEWLERGTGVSRAHIRGVHLLLPGHGAGGPTLEIFSYDEVDRHAPPVANRVGFTHVAFVVPDVEAAVGAVVTKGGSRVGDTVSREIPGAGAIEFAYVRDPEGNMIELQRWSV